MNAELAGTEQVTGSLTKRGLDRINLIESEYVLHMCRAELTWVRDIIAEIESGELTWQEDRYDETTSATKEYVP